MKPSTPPLPNMYQEKRARTSSLLWVNLRLTLWVLLLLVMLRLLNLVLCGYMVRLELSHHAVTTEAHYTFLTFASQAAAEKVLQSAPPLHRKKGAALRVVVYFNLGFPAHFLVQNHTGDKVALVDLGPAIFTVKPGITHYALDLDNRFYRFNPDGSTTSTQRLTPTTLDNPPPLPIQKNKKVDKKVDKKAEQISFILKEREQSAPLKIPYTLYFLLPLLGILLFTASNTRAMWTAYLYFPITYLLFDAKELFFRTPLGWFMDSTGVANLTSLQHIIPPALALLFLLLGIVGLYHWKKRSERFGETLTVFFFLLLPIFLRF